MKKFTLKLLVIFLSWNSLAIIGPKQLPGHNYQLANYGKFKVLVMERELLFINTKFGHPCQSPIQLNCTDIPESVEYFVNRFPKFNDSPIDTEVFFTSVESQRWNSYSNGRPGNGRKSSRTGSYYLEEANGGKSTEVNPLPKNQTGKPSVRGGIGAWGYVSIILFVILSGLGIYYTVIFYPIVCKKQRMYHVMGSTTV